MNDAFYVPDFVYISGRIVNFNEDEVSAAIVAEHCSGDVLGHLDDGHAWPQMKRQNIPNRLITDLHAPPTPLFPRTR